MNSPTASPYVVVTGTGTDVGKTYVTAALLRLLSVRGVPCLGLKPIETGYAPERSDAQTLAQAAAHQLVEPWFTSVDPVSPHRAARQANTTLAPSPIREWLLAQKKSRPQALAIVETAGGLFTPIAEHLSMLDLVAALEPCCFLLVAEDRLGTLHQVAAAVHAAGALHRRPDAILLNRRDPAAHVLENGSELERLALGPPVFALASDEDLDRSVTWLLRQTRREG